MDRLEGKVAAITGGASGLARGLFVASSRRAPGC